MPKLRPRLTNLPGVCHGLPRTPDGCKEALRRYETANADLPQPTRRLLALAAVGPRFGRKNVEAATGGRTPNFPFRDFAWRWWNVLHLSGLEEHWDAFKDLAQTEGLRAAAAALRKAISPERYQTFLRRSGSNPHNHHRRHRGSLLWTKGGCWRRESPFTTLLVRKLHLPERPVAFNWHLRLGREGVRLIERELMRLIDPDKMLVHEAKQLALSYTATRMQELCGWKVRPGPKKLAWFFQWPIPNKHGYLVEIAHPGYYFRTRRRKRPHLYEW